MKIEQNSGEVYIKEIFEEDIIDGTLTIPDGVTQIANPDDSPLFQPHIWQSIKSIIIPDSITSIGDWTFPDCTSLTSINVDKNNSAYCDIDGLLFNKDKTELICYPQGNTRRLYIIPDSVTNIGGYAFYDCKSLTSITISYGVTSISYGAFYFCTSLTSINVDKNNSAYCDIDGILFNMDKTELICYPQGNTRRSYIIPDSVTSIGNYAFSGCTSLTSINIPNSVTSIGYGAFDGCKALTSITIPNSVTNIGEYAFYYCTSLSNITIPNSITSIGYSAFEGCTSLTSVTMPNSVTSIGKYAFKDCESLTSVTIPDSVTSFGNYAFSECTSLKNIAIPDSVTNIGALAFKKCISLSSITIPDSVTSIGEGAFSKCTSLSNISVNQNNKFYCDIDGVLFNKDKTELIQYPIAHKKTSYIIPNSVISIGDCEFEGCESLTAITIPNSVINIGDFAFFDCKSLKNIAIPNSVISIGDKAFFNCENLTIKCYKNSAAEKYAIENNIPYEIID